MKKTLIILILACLGLGSETSAQDLQNPFRDIALSGVKMRAAPELDAPLISVLEFAETVQVLDTVSQKTHIEWLEGQWVKLRADGREGYVFDGFLSRLPIPLEEYELTSNDADVSLPLVSWAENNFKIISPTDTLQAENYIKHTQYFDNGITLTTREGMYAFEVKLHIPGIRLGDAYNLTRSMMLTSTEKALFEENTLFIKNNQDVIDKVNISIDAPIEIRKTHDGVELTVTSYQHVCGL